MITYQLLSLVETVLDKYLESHIVPTAEAYPTSGSVFTRVSGVHTDIIFRDASVVFTPTFEVSHSVRTRDYVAQNKRKPYEILLNLQEKTFFVITQDTELISGLYTLADQLSVSGRYTSTVMRSQVQPVYPDFYGSEDYSSRREAGYVLSQEFTAPVITIPFICLEFPSPLDLQSVELI